MIAPFSDVFHPFHCRYFQSFINTLEFLFLISVIGRFLYITTYFYPFLLTYSAHLRSIGRMQFVHVFFAHFSHFPLISSRILGVFHLIIITFHPFSSELHFYLHFHCKSIHSVALSTNTHHCIVLCHFRDLFKTMLRRFFKNCLFHHFLQCLFSPRIPENGS